MRIRFLLTLIGLTSGVALQGIAQWRDTADPQAARQLVSFYDSALSLKYEKAFNEKNAEALASLFTEDALLVAPEGLFSGRAAIEKRYAGVFQRSHLTDFFGMRSQLNAIGDELCAVGSWWSLLQTERGPLQVGGHWLEIYAREGDGWKIRVSIFNVSPSQDQSPQQPILAASDL